MSIRPVVDSRHDPERRGRDERPAAARRRRIVGCGRCGVALWFHHRLWKERIKLVAIGTLDGARAFPPRAHCFVRSKHPWVGLPADAIAADEFFDPGSCWTPEEMGRLAAALARS